MHAIALRSTLVSFVFAGISLVCVADEVESPTIDSESGLKIDAEENWKLVKAHCSSCHSGRLLAQHSMSREDWQKNIRRMQSDESLWDLGVAEEPILDYLSDIYGTNESESTQRVRRPPLNQGPIESDGDAEQVESSQNENQTSVETEGSKPPPKPRDDS